MGGWIKKFKSGDKALSKKLYAIYGNNESLVKERVDSFLLVLIGFREIYGDEEEVHLIRAPGRLNLMGRHVDHRGSFINTICIDREIIMGYRKGDDDLIEIHNLDNKYGARKFNIKSLTEKGKAGRAGNDWINKIMAAPAYLQGRLFPDRELHGFHGVIYGNIPPRLGLSSSSSLVVAMMEAMMRINDLAIPDEQLASHCGATEWFVGTRGVVVTMRPLNTAD